MTPTSLQQQYDQLLSEQRSRLLTDPALIQLLDPDIDEQLLHGFLIEFSSRGVKMTEQVADWIARAGRRCREVGLLEIGSALLKHARHEEGHDLLLVQDTRHLIEAWNPRWHDQLDARTLIDRPLTPTMTSYVQLHERTLHGPTPFLQVAIELEIENISVVFGSKFLQQCRTRLEPRAREGLSFIREHVALDVGHTAFNRNMLERTLRLRADALELLAATGNQALDIYLRFLGECFQEAERKSQDGLSPMVSDSEMILNP